MGNVFGSPEDLPSSVIVFSSDDYHIRKEEARLEVVIQAENIDKAFWALADYFGVFGKPFNRPHIAFDSSNGEKIPMIFPAYLQPIECPSKDGPKIIASFVLPKTFSNVKDAPVPLNPAISVRLVPKHFVAVLKFPGAADTELCSDQVEELALMMARDRIRVVGKWKLALYNSCVSPKFLRKNEMHLPIEWGVDSLGKLLKRRNSSF